MDYTQAYQSKLTTAADAAKVIQSGQWVDIGSFAGQSIAVEAELAKRKDELQDVNILAMCATRQHEVVKADPTGEVFTINSFHFSGVDRKNHDKGGATFYGPMVYHDLPTFYRNRYINVDVAVIPVTPMDKFGYFNLGPNVSHTRAIIENAKTVILEVWPQMPRCLGGYGELVHISEVDHVVEYEHALVEVPSPAPSDIDKTIAGFVVNELVDGSCIQLGIGGMPNAVGLMIAQSDLKDLGIHTEMFTDSMVDMVESGRVTGLRKQLDPGKVVYTFCMGTKRAYDFLDNNPNCATFPVDYVNDPGIIGMNDNVVAINNCLEIDLYGQVASESSGTRHISGTGGQLDFIEGAYRSRNGKGFMCMTSTVTNKAGEVKSRIRPMLQPGTIVTTPRMQVHYIATEFGLVNLKGATTWQRTERLISVAHPDFREELIREAEAMKIWRNSNKR